MLTIILTLLLTIILSAIFSGSEVAYLSANKLRLEIEKNKDSRSNSLISSLYKDPKTFLSTLLVGNNIVLVVYSLIFSSLLTPWLESYLHQGSIAIPIITTLILTLIILVFGEFIPKALFSTFPDASIIKLAPLLVFFKSILLIPSFLLTKISNVIIRLFFGKIDIVETVNITKLDLEHYIQASVHEEKEIGKEILTNALNLNLLKVRDCMIPRNEIVFVDKSDDLDTVKNAFLSSKHSRLIVVEGDLENVVGYIHQQVFLKSVSTIKRNILEIKFIPEVMNVQDLMNEFIKSGSNIACVVDEFGSTTGLITLEDILEEIFGEIDDEYDDEAFTEKILSEREFLFSGRLEIGYLNGKYEIIDLPEEDYNTLSGYIVMTHGSIPEVGEEIILGNYKFIITSVSDTKIEEVHVIKLLDHTDKIDE